MMNVADCGDEVFTIASEGLHLIFCEINTLAMIREAL